MSLLTHWLSGWLTASSKSNFDLRCACISWLIQYYDCVGVISLSLSQLVWFYDQQHRHNTTWHRTFFGRSNDFYISIFFDYFIWFYFDSLISFDLKLSLLQPLQRRVHWNSLEIKVFFFFDYAMSML